MKTAEIRSKFLNFFKKNGHTFVESSSLVPYNDPTLLFTNAGMNQFKDTFLGLEERSYKRAVSVQKVVRAGGKHNDLENVGFTARHLTFFEMLGNFSFGDYFKKEAIKYAWEFVTQELKLPKDRLYVSVFKEDDESAEIWEKQEGVPKERIFRFGEKDNFWSMGETGPCGPCSEIFFDRGEKYSTTKNSSVETDDERFVEFWNLVFMQFNRDKNGKLTPLPKPSVDTGAGLERLAMILQDKETNYDADGFQEIFKKTETLSGRKYGKTKKETIAFRVLADHARSTAFLISDGVLPSNEGRGYVLRRIMRRAIRIGKSLGFSKPFFYQIALFVVDQMKSAYPQLDEQKDFIKKAVFAEEEQFFKTLERGLTLLDDEISKLDKGSPLSGKMAFKLYDTYGFPLDLTRVICEEKGIKIDEDTFEKCMEKQRSESRKHWKGSGEEATDAIYHQIESSLKTKGIEPTFTGYDQLYESSKCISLLTNQNGKLNEVERCSSDRKEIKAIFESTPFYGESGGQVGDTGTIQGNGFSAEVVDTQKPLPSLTVLSLKPIEGEINVNFTYEQKVDPTSRTLTAKNHTATHLLQWALREVLGNHVKQAGSLVNSSQLRFDFTHFQAMTENEIRKTENLINQKIFSSDPVKKKIMSKEKALDEGAIAFFGEKYGSTVRVVQVGNYSTELCGGTHVDRSSDIQTFKIVSESGIAAGVRRIIAYTSTGAFEYLRKADESLKAIRDRLKASTVDEIMIKLKKMSTEEKSLRKQIEQLRSQSVGAEIETIIEGANRVGETEVVTSIVNESPHGIKHLREVSDKIKQKLPKSILVLGMKQKQENKALILVAATPEISKVVGANLVLKELLSHIKGKGGGKPELAQAGGSHLEGLEPAIQEAQKIISQKLT